jgi:hypothetical protein
VNLRWIVAAALAGFAPWAAASCYLVYAPAGELVYRSVESPIDLSLPLSRGLAARYPNHQMVIIGDESNCLDLGTARDADLKSSGKPLDATHLLAARAPDMIGTSDRGRATPNTTGLTGPGVPVPGPSSTAARATAPTK